MATSSARQPLTEDIIYHVGLCLLPKPWEKAPTPAEGGYFEMDMACLRSLTYLSRATKRLLEPLLFRFVLLSTPQDVVHFYIDLIQIPRIREYVRHLACVTRRRSPGDMSDLRVNRMLRIILDDRIGGRDKKLSLMKQGAAWEPFVDTFSPTETPEEHLGSNLRMRRDVDYMIRSILLSTTKLKTLVWHLDEFGRLETQVPKILKSAAKSDHVLLLDLEVMALNYRRVPSINQYSHLPDFSWEQERGYWKNLRRLVLYDTDFDDGFGDMLYRVGKLGDLVPVEELIVRAREGGPEISSLQDFSVPLDSHHLLFRPTSEAVFRFFEKVKLLDISFGYFSPRNESGSVMLEAFVHWLGAPERLYLTGHPPPFKALARGTVHPRLKSIELKKWKDEEDLEQDEMRQKVEDWWRSHSAVVPNLEEFVVQRVGESKVCITKP